MKRLQILGFISEYERILLEANARPAEIDDLHHRFDLPADRQLLLDQLLWICGQM